MDGWTLRELARFGPRITGSHLVADRDLSVHRPCSATCCRSLVRLSILEAAIRGLRVSCVQDRCMSHCRGSGQTVRVASRNFLTICLTRFITFLVAFRVTTHVLG